MTRHSPCVGICALDGISGFCLGCARSRDEIAAWMAMSEAERDAVWLKLPERLRALNIRVTLLPWTPGEIIGFIAETLTKRRGTWRIGDASALAIFPPPSDNAIEVAAHGDTVIARAVDRAFRIRIKDKVRAFSFAGSERIALILPKARAKLSSESGLSRDIDCDAIDEDERGQPIHDLETSDRNVRLAIRSADFRPSGADEIGSAQHVTAMLSSSSISDDATIVWETAIARIEISASSFKGHLATVSLAEPDIPFNKGGNAELPAYAAEVATFHPQNRPDG